MKRKADEKSLLLPKSDDSSDDEAQQPQRVEEDPEGQEGQQKPKEFPTAAVLLSCMITLCEVTASNSIYPYVNFMMKWFNIPEIYQGYYVGILASSYFLAQFLGSFGWAYITRRFTRRAVLLTGMIGVSAASLMLGFSRYYAMAVVSRFMCGLFSGTSGMARTILGEVATPEIEARLFSFLGIAWGVGTITGPLIGGLLSDPCNQFGFVSKDSVMCQFPYLLPNYANVILLTIAMLFVVIAIPPAPSPQHSINANVDPNSSIPLSITETTNDVLLPPPAPRTSSWNLFKERNVWVTCVIYSLVTFAWSIFEEVFPLWTYWTGFSARQLGLLQSFGGLLGIIFQITSYPQLAKRAGLFGTLRLGCISTVFGFCAITWVVIVFPYANRITIWILAAVYIFVQFGGEVLFVTSITAMNLSTEEQNLDLVNYMGQGLGAATRTIGPASGASLFAYCQIVSRAPVDQHLVFYIAGSMAVMIFLLSFLQKISKANIGSGH